MRFLRFDREEFRKVACWKDWKEVKADPSQYWNFKIRIRTNTARITK